MAMYEYDFRGFHDRFLSTVDIYGDTLSVFKSYNPVVKEEDRNSGREAESHNKLIYYFNNQLTIRQSYNDPIFRIVSGSEIRPAYIIKTGDKKMTPYIAMYGMSDSKIRIRGISESHSFLMIKYQDNRVRYLVFYDKLTKELYLDLTGNNDGTKSISIPEALPFAFYSEPVVSDDIVFTGYTMQSFQQMNKAIEGLSW